MKDLDGCGRGQLKSALHRWLSHLHGRRRDERLHGRATFFERPTPKLSKWLIAFEKQISEPENDIL